MLKQHYQSACQKQKLKTTPCASCTKTNIQNPLCHFCFHNSLCSSPHKLKLATHMSHICVHNMAKLRVLSKMSSASCKLKHAPKTTPHPSCRLSFLSSFQSPTRSQNSNQYSTTIYKQRRKMSKRAAKACSSYRPQRGNHPFHRPYAPWHALLTTLSYSLTSTPCLCHATQT